MTYIVARCWTCRKVIYRGDPSSSSIAESVARRIVAEHAGLGHVDIRVE